MCVMVMSRRDTVIASAVMLEFNWGKKIIINLRKENARTSPVTLNAILMRTTSNIMSSRMQCSYMGSFNLAYGHTVPYLEHHLEHHFCMLLIFFVV